MTALQAHQSLAPATNYTDSAVRDASNNLARVIANAAPADYVTVSNRAMTALQAHQSLAPSTNYTDAAILAASNNIVQSIGPMAAGVTTNDVCNIVTNVVTPFSDWVVFIDGIRKWDWPAVVQYRSVDPGDNAVRTITVRGPSTVACYIMESRYDSGLPPFNPNETAITNTIASGDILFSEYNYLIGSQLVLTRTAYPRNALGLARLVDVPSNNAQLINGAGYTTTNDVCAIVTNETVAGWTYPDLPEGYKITTMQWDETSLAWYAEAERLSDGLWFEGDAESPEGAAARVIHFDIIDGVTGDNRLRFTAVYVDGGNALGLARLSDIPTNHVTRAEMQEAIDGIDIPSTNGFVTASITNGLATTNWVSRASRFDHLYEIELYGTMGSPAPIYSFNGRMLSMTTEKTIFMGDLYDIANFEQDEAATYWHNFSSDRIFTVIIYADLTANESLNGVTIDAYEYPCSLFFSNLFLFILGLQVDFAENSDFASVTITEVE